MKCSVKQPKLELQKWARVEHFWAAWGRDPKSALPERCSGQQCGTAALAYCFLLAKHPAQRWGRGLELQSSSFLWTALQLDLQIFLWKWFYMFLNFRNDMENSLCSRVRTGLTFWLDSSNHLAEWPPLKEGTLSWSRDKAIRRITSIWWDNMCFFTNSPVSP